MLVTIFSGSIIFFLDLIRELPMRMHIGLIAMSGRTGATTESRGPKILENLGIAALKPELPDPSIYAMCIATLENPTCSGIGAGATAEAPAKRPTTSAERASLPVELLDGGEVVILALKPSRWFVLFDSIKWIVAGVVVMAGAALTGGRLEWVSYSTLTEWTVVVIACRVAVALLRWVSRFYVLTNRRTLHIRGVLHAEVLDIALTDILNTRVTIGWHERLLGLGTLRFSCAQPAERDPSWHHLTNPDEVHAEVRRAIERAIDRHHQA